MATYSKNKYNSVHPKLNSVFPIKLIHYDFGPGRKLQWPRFEAGAIFIFWDRGLCWPRPRSGLRGRGGWPRIGATVIPWSAVLAMFCRDGPKPIALMSRDQDRDRDFYKKYNFFVILDQIFLYISQKRAKTTLTFEFWRDRAKILEFGRLTMKFCTKKIDF